MNTTEALRRAIGLGAIGGLPPVDSAEARAFLLALDNSGFTSAPDSDFISDNSDFSWVRRDDGTRRLTSYGKYVAEVYAALRDAEARTEQPPPAPGGEPIQRLSAPPRPAYRPWVAEGVREAPPEPDRDREAARTEARRRMEAAEELRILEGEL